MPISISIQDNYEWTLSVLNRNLEKSLCSMTTFLPMHMDNSSAEYIFRTISLVKVCEGNNDFPDLIHKKLTDTENFTSTQKRNYWFN